MACYKEEAPLGRGLRLGDRHIHSSSVSAGCGRSMAREVPESRSGQSLKTGILLA